MESLYKKTQDLLGEIMKAESEFDLENSDEEFAADKLSQAFDHINKADSIIGKLIGKY